MVDGADKAMSENTVGPAPVERQSSATAESRVSIEEVYFSYRDINEEVQHCKVAAADAGRLLGDAMTLVYRLRRAAAELAEIADSDSDLLSRRQALHRMAMDSFAENG